MAPTTQIHYERLVQENTIACEEKQQDDVAIETKSTAVSRIPDWFKEEMKGQIKLAWPLVLVVVFMNIVPTVSLAFTGHLDTTSLAGQSLALSLINVLVMGVGIGLTSACDTMFAQTFGTGQKKEIGNQLQRCLILMTLYCFPIWALFLNAESLLLLTGQEPVVAKIAADYLLWFSPGVWFNFIYNVLSRYLMAQNIVKPLVIVGFLANIINAGCHYLFLFVFDFGYRGSSISLAGAYACLAAFATLYILISRIHKPTWDGWSFSAFKNWGTFNRLAIPGMFMVLLEWSTLEVSTIMAGTLGEVEVSSQIIILQLAAITYSMFFGVSVVASVRVGQSLGKNDPLNAKRVVKVTFVLSLCCCTLASLFLVSFHDLLPSVFSNDSRVIELVSDILWIIAPYQFLAGFSIVYSGILRGCGRQTVGAIVYLVWFYGFTIPLALYLMLGTPLGVEGNWYGTAAGQFLSALTFCLVVFCTNWEKEVAKVGERTGLTLSDDRNISYGSTRADEPAAPRDKDEMSVAKIILMRVAAVVFAGSLLFGALMVRLYVPKPSSYWPNEISVSNTTMNATQIY